RGRARRGSSHGLRFQDPGEHGPGPPRPHRIPQDLLRRLPARNAAASCAARQGGARRGRAHFHGRRSPAGRRGLGRRHHWPAQPRHDQHRRHLHRGRADHVHGHPELRARALPARGAQGPAAHEGAAEGPRPALRGRRDAAVPAAAQQRPDTRSRRAAAVRRGRLPARRRVRRHLRLRAGKRRHRALDRRRGPGEGRAVPRAGARAPCPRPRGRARLPRADTNQPRPHDRALAGSRLPRDARAPCGGGVKRALLRRPVIGWALYDWANSAFATTVMAGFFPVFFKQYWSVGTEAAVSTFRLGLLNGAGSLVVALSAPLLGAMADRGGVRLKLLALFTLIGAAATAGLYAVEQGDWIGAAIVYSLAGVGFWGGIIFNDSLLVDVAAPPEYDVVSAFGYALGYVGGGLLLLLNVAMVTAPASFGLASASDAVRLSFPMVGVWWALFMIPCLLWVHEQRPARPLPPGAAAQAGWRELR